MTNASEHSANGHEQSLTDFLLARIAEDVSAARDVQHQSRSGRPLVTFNGGGTGIRQLVDPDRLVAECEAKRAIVTEVAYFLGQKPAHMLGEVTAVEQMMQRPLRHLALPYADHPDYRDEWRP